MPLSNEELLILFRQPESERVERKAYFGNDNKSKIYKTLCAFANDLNHSGQPGVLFIGQKDDGSCAGQDFSGAKGDDIEKSLADLRAAGKLLPLPSLEIRRLTLDDCDVIATIVEPHSAPPVYYDENNMGGQIYVRVGPTTRVANREDEKKLLAKRTATHFDLQPVRTSSIMDLDLSYFRETYLPNAVADEVLEQNERSVEERLQALRFMDAQGQATVLGLLIAGKTPRRFLPNAYVQFLRIAGHELGDPIQDQEEIEGKLGQMIIDLERISKINITQAKSTLSDPNQPAKPSYPFAALRQLLINAVLHRDYETSNAPISFYWFDERIEIISPGGPFGQVNVQNFGQPNVTDYRNPNLAAALKHLGYVERFGYGIPTAKRELAKNTNPLPEFEVKTHGAGNYVKVIIRKAQDT